MSDQTNPQANLDPAAPPATPPAAPPTPATDTISISREEYSQMTTQLAVAQAQLERILEDRQLQQQQAPAPKADPTGGKNINEMTNAEMFEMIVNQVNSQVAQPLLNTIMQLSLKEEMRDVQDRYPDFKEVKKEVYQVAEKNTSLSLEQAYLIVKATKNGQPPPVAPPKQDPAPTPPAPPGEKPGVNSANVTQETKLTTRQAAEAALKALKYA